MPWSLKRQIFYILFIILFFTGFGFLIIYPSTVTVPTCVDGIQNGTETGVDCGGSCVRACFSSMQDLSVMWARSFRVVEGRYNAVAYFINHNKNAAVQKINYKFRFADKNNIFIADREGSTFIPPSGNFAVFEAGVDVGKYVPVYVDFEFTQVPAWSQVPQERIDQLKVLVSNIELLDELTSPKLSASIKNNSLFTIPNVNIIVILYDALGNAVSASRTFLKELMPFQESNIGFTWQEPFSSPVASKEIIPMYNLFSVKVE